MHKLRTYLSGLLLVLFVGGGVLAPNVHRAQHQVHTAEDHQQHADALQVTAPSVFDGAAFPDTHDLTCWLCNTHLVFKPHAQPSAPVPALRASPVNTDALDQVAAASHHTSLIRGPPLG